MCASPSLTSLEHGILWPGYLFIFVRITRPHVLFVCFHTCVGDRGGEEVGEIALSIVSIVVRSIVSEVNTQLNQIHGFHSIPFSFLAACNASGNLRHLLPTIDRDAMTPKR